MKLSQILYPMDPICDSLTRSLSLVSAAIQALQTVKLAISKGLHMHVTALSES